MEENVALDSSKQKKFLKGIKKLAKNNVEEEPKTGTAIKRKRKEKGLVYLSHIPHGFYEDQMSQYFKQFGTVTNVRVIRSKRTGRSKGYAFIEFKEPTVGEIVAETMNNYLMGKRLLKAKFIPPNEQRKAFRKKWNSFDNPSNIRRMKLKKVINANKTDTGNVEKAKKLLDNLTQKLEKLKNLGIDYKFMPSDIPEELLKGKENHNKKGVENKLKSENVGPVKKKKGISESQEKTNTRGKKLKNLGEVIKLEEFIKVDQDSTSDQSDDSSYKFDSDEYEKFMENDDEFNSDLASETDRSSGDESEHSDGTNDSDVNETSLGPLKPKKGKVEHVPKILHPDVLVKVTSKNLTKEKGPHKMFTQNKRKVSETVISAKKRKFEKRNNKLKMKKQK